MVRKLVALPPLPHVPIASLSIGEVALNLVNAVNPVQLDIVPYTTEHIGRDICSAFEGLLMV
jgi:hypothetical protein